jgi:hypothetical protein
LGSKRHPVFLGTVLATTALPPGHAVKFSESRKVRIRVDDSFGGLPAGMREIEVLTGTGGGDCGVPFQIGDVYLVYSYAGDDGVLHTSTCSSTRKVDGASSGLRVLRQKRSGKREPALTGQIVKQKRDFGGSFGYHDSEKLAHLRIRL